MADEAFALSPISARAAQPSEADYDAIREAFMETARGRWFLSEYGKRNRNADTTMVLDAVARIERGIAAQKQPLPTGLLESLDAIRGIIDDARSAAAQTFVSADQHPAVTAAREGARIVREVAWTLRECGADVRICDLLDAQVAAIDAGQQQMADPAIRDAVLATFDDAMRRIDGLATDAPVASRSAPPVEEAAIPAAASPDIATAPVSDSETSALPQPEPDAVAAEPESLSAEAEFAADAPISPEMSGEPNDGAAANDDAHDDAVLDLIAMEMGMEQPDPPDQEFDRWESTASDDAGIAGPEPDAMTLPQHVDIAERPLADAVSAHDQTSNAVQSARGAAMSASNVSAAAESASLGAALFASGLVPRPSVNGPDPLAPIRRMSQAERIAFFS